MRSLKIVKSVLYEMLTACRLGYPKEACGLLGGRADVAHTHYPLRNVAPSPTENFLGDPEDHMRAVRLMAAKGEELVGIYHSHPQTDPVPSHEDIKQAAYPKTPHLIVSLAPGMRPRMRAFLLNPQGMRAVEIHWYVVRPRRGATHGEKA